MGRIISISAFHGAVPENSLPLKLGLFRLSSTRFFPQIAQFDQGTNRQDFRPSPSLSAFICVICGHEIPWSLGFTTRSQPPILSQCFSVHAFASKAPDSKFQ